MVRIPFFDFDEPEPEPAEDPAVAQAAADRAHEAADQAAREVLYGREHAYAIRLGNEALTREQPALAAIDRGYRAARAGLSPEARAAFDARAAARRQAWRDQVQGMAADQRAKLKLESARLRQNYAAYDLYQAVDRQDHDAADAHADLLHEAALRHGQLSGLDPAAAQAQAAGKVGETIASGITRVAAADPQSAQAALDRHGARMGEEHRATAQAAVADGGMAQLNAMGPLNSAGLPVNHYFGPDGGPQPVRRAPPPPSTPPGQQRQPLHDLADKAVDFAKQKVRESKAWAQDKADELRGDAIGFTVDQATRFPELRKAAHPLMRAWEIAEGHSRVDRSTAHSTPPPAGQGVTAAQLKNIMPGAGKLADKYVGFINAAMAAEGITTPTRQAAFLAQVASETGDLRLLREELSHRSLKTLQDAYLRFRQHPELGPQYIRNPRGLANLQYDGSNGNRVGTDDGFN